MSSRSSWQQFRDNLLDLPELQFRLDLSKMDIPSSARESLTFQLKAAISAMAELEGGSIANPDEGRMVGHYWLRTPATAPNSEIAELITETRTELISFVEKVHQGAIRPETRERFTQLLVVGIGGSALGPQFIADALGGVDDPLTPHFLDNTDPDGMDRVLDQLGTRLAETLVVVISKSGGTPETRNGMLETQAAMEAHGLTFGRHAVAITQEGSKLDQYADSQEFITRFPMWDWVGGRTSVTSAVGLLPAALQGLDIDGLLEGAAQMDEATRNPDPKSNPAALLALAWHHGSNGRGEKDMVILPYRDRLALFSRYLQQLIMESLGKREDLDGKVVHQGIAVYGNKGSTDQHAYVQQLREGVANFFATFVQVRGDREGESIEVAPDTTSADFLNGFFLGTRAALYEAGRESITITVDQVDAATLGRLIALYERAVGLYAHVINVNAYHQPGVEAGKSAAAAILTLQGRARDAINADAKDAATLAQELDAAPEDLFHVLEHLADSERITRIPGDHPCDNRYVQLEESGNE